MMLLPCTILSLIIVSNSFAASDSAGGTKNINTSNPVVGPEFKIRHLHLLFRHGDRSPIVERIVHGDAVKRMWPQGYGQLTDIGILQEFRLGQWIRSNYGEFIPSEYNASLYHMRSTDLDRTLMSAQCVSAGVFLDSSSPLKPYGIQWRPVPVHTVPQTEDILLSTADCPCLSVLQDVEMNSEKSVQFEHDHSKLFELLSNKTGTHVNRHNLWEYSDTLTCMRAHNYTMPEWYTEQLYQEMQEVESFYWAMKFISTEEILRREIGVFLHSFVTHINAVVQDSMNMTRPLDPANLSTWHTMAYSAHDKDVAYVLAALGVYDERMVDNSAAIVLELLGPDKKQADSLSDFIIRIRYKRGWSDLKGEYLQFPSCHDRPATAGCPWNKLLEQIQTLLVSPEQYAELCSNMSYTNGPMHDSRLRTFILVSSGLCATAVMVLLTVFLMRRFRRQKHLLQDDEQVVFVRFDQHSL